VGPLPEGPSYRKGMKGGKRERRKEEEKRR